MIDGIKIKYELGDFESWVKVAKPELFLSVDTRTGLVKEKITELNGVKKIVINHYGHFETFNLRVKEVRISAPGVCLTKHYLTINGSLHKNHFNGNNYLPFNWTKLQSQITYIEDSLQLKSEKGVLENIETGLNIRLPWPPFPFLQATLLNYKGAPFRQFNYDKKNVSIGFESCMSQYKVKAYDKGLQFGLPYNLFRFELSFIKMQKINKIGIYTLSDLKNKDKVNKLGKLIIDGWKNVLLNDISILPCKVKLKPLEYDLLKDGTKAMYWDELKKRNLRRYNYERLLFKKLVDCFGIMAHGKINKLLQDEWQVLLKN